MYFAPRNSHQNTAPEIQSDLEEKYSSARDQVTAFRYRELTDWVAEYAEILEGESERLELDMNQADDAGDSNTADQLEAQMITVEDKMWKDNNTDESLRRATKILDSTRTKYAEELANRSSNTVFNRGSGLKAGVNVWGKFDSESLKEDNPQFAYEVALGIVTLLLEDKIHLSASDLERAGTPLTPGEAEKQRKFVIIENLLGKVGDPDANANGELFKLNEAVRQQRLLKSKLYEMQNDTVVKKEGDRFEKPRDLAAKFFKRWNVLSERAASGTRSEKAKAIAEKAAYIAGGGLLTGVVLASGAAAFGVAGAVATAAASRISKTAAVTQLEKRSGALRATYDAGKLTQIYQDERANAYTKLESGSNHWATDGMFGVSETISADFTHKANKLARRNQQRMSIGFIATGGAAAVMSGLSPAHLIGGGDGHREDLGAKPGAGTSRSEPRVSRPAPPSNRPTAPEGSSAGRPGGNGDRSAPSLGERKVVIEQSKIGDKYVATVYEQSLGLHAGFTEMIRNAHAAIAQGELSKIQPDPSNPDRFWYRVTKKGAKILGKRAEGSTMSTDIMRILAQHSTKVKLS